jgi:hypothetical protein
VDVNAFRALSHTRLQLQISDGAKRWFVPMNPDKLGVQPQFFLEIVFLDRADGWFQRSSKIIDSAQRAS